MPDYRLDLSELSRLADDQISWQIMRLAILLAPDVTADDANRFLANAFDAAEKGQLERRVFSFAHAIRAIPQPSRSQIGHWLSEHLSAWFAVPPGFSPDQSETSADRLDVDALVSFLLHGDVPELDFAGEIVKALTNRFPIAAGYSIGLLLAALADRPAPRLPFEEDLTAKT